MTLYLITFRSLTHAQRSARLLERRGMTVRTQGYGYVVEQSLAPGQRYTRGEMVYLKLKN